MRSTKVSLNHNPLVVLIIVTILVGFRPCRLGQSKYASFDNDQDDDRDEDGDRRRSCQRYKEYPCQRMYTRYTIAITVVDGSFLDGGATVWKEVSMSAGTLLRQMHIGTDLRSVVPLPPGTAICIR
jgi:hypothetical protein